MSCILHHQGIQLILAYSWARLDIFVASKGRRECFYFFCFFSFIPVSLSSLSLSFISSTISFIAFLPFSGRRHKITHNGWRVVKSQHSQSRLQKGFTLGCSSLNAAFILSECILEAKICKKRDILITTLDTQKAFDIVDYNSLLRRVYIDGVRGDDWLLLKIPLICPSRIKWAGDLSHQKTLQQGVRQGCVLLTSHYKRYNNPLLLTLEERYTGAEAGSIHIPHTTVADNVALLTQLESEMQMMIWDVEHNAGLERYSIHPAKSHTLCYGPSHKKDMNTEFYMAEGRISTSSGMVHLGVVRDTSCKVYIDEKVNLGRRKAYLLKRAGFHGGGGGGWLGGGGGGGKGGGWDEGVS